MEARVGARADAGAVLAGGGEMGALMRSLDWSKTAVGPVEQWPQSLRTALSILLETGFPMYIAWGPEFTQFYNDGYRPILGSTKHPAAMGASTRETFAEIWHIIGPMFEGVLEGRTTTVVDFLLPLDRHGFVEECYFVFSYSPIREESGRVGGVLVTVTETSQRVLSERRLKTTQALAAETQKARTVHEACTIAAQVLERNPADLPFACVYLLAADGLTATQASRCGSGGDELTATLRLDAGPLASAIASGSAERWGSEPGAERRKPAWVVPIVHQGAERPAGILIAGTSERLAFDDPYRDFVAHVASQIGTAIAGARALEEAQTRLEELARLDRAKTAFFSNVSHEFRTPLTLLLGPTEDAIRSADHALRGEELDAVHRNALRLLKLVNTLLDFSRIEAGRVSGAFEPTDLAGLTTDLASAFRSAVERAGLSLNVRCPPLPEPIYVDPEMWEKIVLNLLSNALKFTFQGGITVELAAAPSWVELRVRDTGTGIAPEDLGRVFERFQRVERSAARTHEGSGIGLALVKELVTIHGGTIEASSAVGAGTEFRVRLPRGCAHLPSDRVVAADARHARDVHGSKTVAPYLQEALRWLSADGPPLGASAADAPADTAKLLVADDNADMRDYLVRLLSPRFHVEAVRDGHAALAAALARRPDVIVSDVMMPGLDGFQLIAALRTREQTRHVPIILLSARAGEEARVEGLHAGADDYLVKPFAARELVARVETQLVRAKMRALEDVMAARLASVFAQAPVGIAILRGPEHVFEFANPFYRELVGGRSLVGQPIRSALPELAGQGIYELLDDVYTSGSPHLGRSVRVVLQRQRATAEETFFDFVYQPLVEDERIQGIAVVCFDVSELTIARREAESANRAKDEFLAMLGHELRNPLAPIVTALALMRANNVTQAERERTIIERQVRHLVTLVDDLLDVSRIARGKVQLKRARVDLADVVGKAIEMTSPAIEQRRHALNAELARGLVVEGDPGRLAQVFANLLTNAAKYTEPGGAIGIRAARDGSEAIVSVADSGRGIEADMLPIIFDLFTQERQEIDRSQGGLGLGLAIVKSLVQAHHGSVEARSEGKGRGAEFTIRLPLASLASDLASQSADGARPPPAAPSLRVLVVDDNVDAAELLADSLRALGHVARTAFDGPRAMQAAAEFAPDVALLDLGLPVMDGYELARSLRAPSRTGPRIALAAITGYGREVDRTRTRRAGFDEHFVKPIDLERLAGWLSALGGGGQA